ncbi:MAG: rhodanese-like domain-containing protein [Bacteroidota bacterium]
MKIAHLLFSLLFLAHTSCAQGPLERPKLQNPNFDRTLKVLLDFSIPLMSVQELHAKKDKVIIFDTREWTEYETSHIENAAYLGYTQVQTQQLEKLPKDTTIVLYCSVGYRSEKMGEKLQEMGFNRVYNLYGSLFEWVNAGYPVVDMGSTTTNRVHAYDRIWGQWLEQEQVQKVY